MSNICRFLLIPAVIFSFFNEAEAKSSKCVQNCKKTTLIDWKKKCKIPAIQEQLGVESIRQCKKKIDQIAKGEESFPSFDKSLDRCKKKCKK
ncbi:MAG: hypothetical protein HYS39_01115 [Proteobacteria bacterium]|nr:hypothetical protein [Pseudomonadota bacterium]